MCGHRERFAMAGVMVIAGEYAFPFRSFAHARSLFRIYCVWRGCAPFSSAHSFVVQSEEGGGDDGVPSCVSLIVSFSCRLALSLRSHPVSSCPMCRTLAARFAVAPFCSAHLVVLLPCLAALIAS